MEQYRKVSSGDLIKIKQNLTSEIERVNNELFERFSKEAIECGQVPIKPTFVGEIRNVRRAAQIIIEDNKVTKVDSLSRNCDEELMKIFNDYEATQEFLKQSAIELMTETMSSIAIFKHGILKVFKLDGYILLQIE